VTITAGKIAPEDLFSRHLDDAVEVAKKYISKFSLVGSRSYKEDIIAEASKGLWQACTRFSPDKQVLHSSQNFWSLLFSNELPPDYDPYATFWTYAKSRVHGSIRDYLRKEKITTRQYDESDKSLILEDRVVSIDGVMPRGFDESSGSLAASRDRYSDYFRSSDTADKLLQDDLAAERLQEFVSSAQLSDLEAKVVMMAYRPPGMDVEEIASDMQKPPTVIRKTLKVALLRIVETNLHPATVSG
jgi:RNA polymerase sigma factor (sigma-70 family)